MSDWLLIAVIVAGGLVVWALAMAAVLSVLKLFERVEDLERRSDGRE